MREFNPDFRSVFVERPHDLTGVVSFQAGGKRLGSDLGPLSPDSRDLFQRAEVKELWSWKEQVLVTRDLSAGGCFVKTAAPLPKGSRIRVRIEHAGAEFPAIGKVTDK